MVLVARDDLLIDDVSLVLRRLMSYHTGGVKVRGSHTLFYFFLGGDLSQFLWGIKSMILIDKSHNVS